MDEIPWANNENLDDSQFYGRAAEFNRLKQFLMTTENETPPDILLTGDRGVGKTVLLKKLQKELEEYGFLVAYINFSHSQCFKTKNTNVRGLMEFYFKKFFLTCSDNSLSIETDDYYFDEFQKVNDVAVPVVKSEITTENLMEYVLTFPQKVYNANSDKFKGIIILIDDFQIIKELGDDKESFLWVIRSYIQNQRNIAYVFAGSVSIYDSLISEISGSQGVFGGRMISFHLSAFSKSTVKQYLDEKKPGLKFSEDAFSTFYNNTLGIPAYINNFAKILPENIDLTSDLIVEKFNESIYYISSNLVNIWYELSYKSKLILVSILNEPKRRMDIAKSLNVTSPSLSPNLRELENFSLIYKSGDNLYSFSQPLLSKWLQSEYSQKGEYPFTAV